MRSFAIAVAAVLVAAVPAAAANARAQANLKARHAADNYTNSHYGIGAGWQYWHASCSRSGSKWICSVHDGGQCHGSLKLSGGLRPYGYRIACLE